MSLEEASVHHSRDLNARSPSANHSHSAHSSHRKQSLSCARHKSGGRKNFSFEDTSCSMNLESVIRSHM